MSPDSVGRTHREVPTRGLNNIRHVLLSQPTLNILNLHYLLFRPGRTLSTESRDFHDFRVTISKVH